MSHLTQNRRCTHNPSGRYPGVNECNRLISSIDPEARLILREQWPVTKQHY
jgi:hypothetical protein